ncbi:DNA-binding MarR family transcriptional regulator [Paenibacillus castaneae]|uniref:MarR family winged helix-turn-helix transcriptional regulator n=1 Tax=Paenibacillus castaneae TaxID=474957 RepID=UPI000C99D616|nr:MarR family transcriptional regulator [Paenibacillus castaneae]NIK78857.1 DNA-binding MarR family transcriptional regulator [Paenibacillus castaneae]
MDALVNEMMETFQRFARAEWRKQSVSGIKSSEVRVLICLKILISESDRGVNITDLSRKLSITSPSITQMIKNLMTDGFVERYNDPRDKRITLIRLTDKGEGVAQKSYERYMLYFSGLIERLGEEQSRTLIALLSEVYSYTHETGTFDG